MHVLVVNAGSSSLKLRVLDDADRVTASIDLAPHVGPDALEGFLASAPRLDASGHRIVHGGRRFRESVAVDESLLGELESLSDLAPLHNPPALRWVRWLREVRPDLPAVACFDTAFHAAMPEAAAVYGIPREWTESLGIRRFGFHGLSHAYASRRAAELLGRPVEALRVVSCHLGAGALAAVVSGRSVDTTMGFTPLEGLIMATRSGSLDPGAVLWVQDRLGLSPAEMLERLERASGLLGMSGVSGDVREVLAAAQRGDPASQLAIAAYGHRARSSIAAMAAAMGGLDAVVFTGGVGEASAEMRADICRGLEFLGVVLDPDRNAAPHGEDADIATVGAAVRVLRIVAREDLEIAGEVRRVLATSETSNLRARGGRGRPQSRKEKEMESGSREGSGARHLRVLVATDGSERALAAGHFVAELLVHGTGEVHLVTVLSGELYPYGPFGERLSDADDRLAAIRGREEAVFGELARALRSGGHRVSTTHRFGNPAVEVLAEVREWGPDLVVVGRRGLGHAAGVILGSVSERLVRHAHVPVLVVP